MQALEQAFLQLLDNTLSPRNCTLTFLPFLFGKTMNQLSLNPQRKRATNGFYIVGIPERKLVSLIGTKIAEFPICCMGPRMLVWKRTLKNLATSGSQILASENILYSLCRYISSACIPLLRLLYSVSQKKRKCR